MLEQLAVEDLSSADCASSSGFDAPGPGAPVIAGVESSVAWDTHLRQVVADLGPVGYVETELVERIAKTAKKKSRR